MTPIERLKELVKEWRETIVRLGEDGRKDAYNECADALEAVIREMEGEG